MPPGWSSHRRFGKDNGPPNSLVYIYANAYNTLLSFARRGFLNTREHIKHLGTDVMPMDEIDARPWSLQRFLNYGTDFFGLHAHFMSWYKADVSVMFVKYEELPQQFPRMLERWKLPPEFIKGFAFRPRTSDWTKQDDWTQKRLKEIYGSHQEFLDSLNGCFVT